MDNSRKGLFLSCEDCKKDKVVTMNDEIDINLFELIEQLLIEKQELINRLKEPQK